jgi:tetratricopeptide (TPR) repeat protein
VRESLAEVCLDDPLVLLSLAMMDPEGLDAMVRKGVLNTDLNPTVEFDREEVPASLATNREFFATLLRHRGDIVDYLEPSAQKDAKAGGRNKIRRYSRQLGRWMEAQMELELGSRPKGMARLLEALTLAQGNTFLKALFLTYIPTDGGLPYFREFLRPAADLMEQMKEDRPAFALIHELLASVHTRLNNPERSLQESEKMVQLRPDDWLYTYSLGHRYRQMGRSNEAIQTFENLLAMESGRAWGLYSLAHVSADQGDLRAAEERLRAALAEKPDFREAKGLLERIQKSIQGEGESQ